MKRKRNIIKAAIAAIIAVVLLPVILTLIIYLPPVQKWAVELAGNYASEATGMDIKVERVSIVFPLDVSIERVSCVKPNDSLPQVRDTIAFIQKAVMDIQLLPLIGAEVRINAFEVLGAKVNTADFVDAARVKGFVGRMAVEGTAGKPVTEVKLGESSVDVSRIVIDNAHLDIALADSVPEDTTESGNAWKIHLGDLSVSRSDLTLHMPGDTLQVGVAMQDVKVHEGDFDLGKGMYSLASLAIKDSGIRYDNNFMPHAVNEPFDPNHIALSDIRLRVDSIYYYDTDLRLKVAECSMKEKCGLALQSLEAMIAMDAAKVNVDAKAATSASLLATTLSMDFAAFEDSSPGVVRATFDASIGKADIVALAPLPEEMRWRWPLHPLTVKAEIDGNIQEIRIPTLAIELPTAFTLDADGEAKGFMALARNLFSPDFTARLHANLSTGDLGFISAIPPLRAVADLNVRGADYSLAMKAVEEKGCITAKAKANIATMAYNATMNVKDLNLGHFVEGMQLGAFTGDMSVEGCGTDFFSPKTRMTAEAEVQQFKFGDYDLNGITSNISLQNGRAEMALVSRNDLLDGNVTLDALLNQRRLDATLATELNCLDMYNLKLVDAPLRLALCTHIDVATDFEEQHKLQGLVSDITIIDSLKAYRPDDIVLDILTNRDTTSARIDCGDFLLRLNAQGGYKQLMETSDRLTAVMEKQFKERTIDQSELRETFPTATMKMHCSQENPIYRIIKYYEFDYETIDIDLATSQESGINGGMYIHGLNTQGYQLDTITVKLSSRSNPDEIKYLAHIKNTPPNEYVFDVFFEGKVLEHGLALGTVFYDDKHEMGMRIGTEATMVEDGLSFHLSPATPIIAYKPFHLNTGNYILLGKNNRIEADVKLIADDGMGIQLYSANDDESNADEDDEEPHGLQDLTLSLNKINMGQLLAAIPYAPNVSGMLNGDIHFKQETAETFTLSSDLTMKDMKYEGSKIGDMGLEMTYMPKTDGSHYVDGHVILDGREIGSINGSYNFDTERINADLTFDKFPMAIANGFVPDQIIGLEGTADGQLSMRGTTMKPDVNGELFLESASLVSVPYGVKLRFDDDPITIKDSRLLFENFQMYANNEQPLVTQGYLDFSDMGHMNLNLRIRAENFLLVDAKETRRSEAYGQAYINLFTSMKGELSKLAVRGRLEVLPSTNLYYILRDSPLTTDNRLKELVTFTDISSEDPLVVERPTVEGLDVNLTVAVDNGSHIKCCLNESHSNYLDIIGEGDLRMKYANDAVNLTGRYTINEGEMKYSLPVIPLKTFNISRGSYIEFNGDMMNPRLNITAKETTKASVDIEGSNQLVTFNTGVKITKTLNDMGLEFLIEAPENQAIADELAMKSAEERAKLAVTMLTTGMYLSDGNTSAFSMNSALNSFLQSEINSIAGNALRTLDLSFGMDNSTGEDGTIHTNYSFKFAKRFWNNRIAISVGGKISTGPDVASQNKSFFDNVELQYRMSDVSNRYMQLFYNNSVYDYLEGYVGQYGAGYMWKKKAQTLREIIGKTTPLTPLRRNENAPTLPQQAQPQSRQQQSPRQPQQQR